MEQEFASLCKYGELDNAKKLIQKYPNTDIHAYGEYPFQLAAGNGHLNIVKWLLELGEKQDKPIDIHADYEFAFRRAAGNGHLNILKWLLELGEKQDKPIDIHARSKYAFRYVAENKHFDTLKYLFRLSGYDPNILKIKGVLPYKEDLIKYFNDTHKKSATK